MCLRKLFLIICSVTIATIAYSQDITGLWTGTMQMPGGCFPINNIDLQLKVTGQVVVFETYHFYDSLSIKKNGIGTYNPRKKLLKLQEVRILSASLPKNCNICMKAFELTYKIKDGKETFTGHWTGVLNYTGSACVPGDVTFYRVNETINNN